MRTPWRSGLQRDTRGLGDYAAIAFVVEVPAAGAVRFNAKIAFVEQAMVRGAKQQQIAQRRFAAVRPMLYMMSVDETTMTAARKAARLIAYEERTLDGRWNRAAFAADGKRLTSIVYRCNDNAGIATKSLRC